jgi:predicted alpha/beta superfamily hydrolase
MIFVGVRPHDRNDEYTPWPAGPVASRAPSVGGGGPRYISELAQQLKPFVDRTFQTMPEPEHTGLAGCSLGGLISLYAYYGYPALFGKIALLSASFWFEGVLDDVRGRTVGSAPPRLFLSVGSLEGAYKRNVQRSMAERTVAVHAALLERGWPSERLKLEVEAEGTHDAMFFARKFPEALIWLFSGEGEHAG